MSSDDESTTIQPEKNKPKEHLLGCLLASHLKVESLTFLNAIIHLNSLKKVISHTNDHHFLM
jgi:hypothetical protein